MKVSVVNLGVNNIKSVLGALEHVGLEAHMASAPGEIGGFCLIPGIGHFGFVAALMARQGWADAIAQHAARGAPVLGICLGMQLLLEQSEEAPGVAGIGLLPGLAQPVRSLGVAAGERVPVTGWRRLGSARPGWSGANMYFNHSFGLDATHPQCLASYSYGGARIAAIIGRDNVLGLQFHPEKSGMAGLHLLKDCVDLLANERNPNELPR